MPEIEPTGNHLMAFGVGCFHFGIRVTKPRSLSQEDYIKDIRSCLEGIDTISDINIDYSPIGNQLERIELAEQPDSMEEGECFPNLGYFEYSFSIYLPYRLQAELTDTEEEYIDSGSEHFRIHTNYTFHGPVSFIECQGAALDSSPSSAVVAVRNYLERQINEKNSSVRFENIGPSPFHADFHLVQVHDSDSKETMFEAEYKYNPGYDVITIRAAETRQSRDLAHLKHLLFRSLEAELGFFYELMRKRSAQMNDWAQIEADLEKLLKTTPEKGCRARLLGPIERRKKQKTLFHDLLSFRANKIFLDSSRQEVYRGLYDSGKYAEIFLKKYLDEEIDNMYTYPTNDILEMVRFEEERTAKTFEWTAVLLAAIVGGVVGSVVTHFIR